MICKSIVLSTIIVCSTACLWSSGQAIKNPSNKIVNMNSSSDNKAEISSDVQALAKNIKLAMLPTEAKWQAKTLGNAQSSVPGPTDYQLIAVLKYTDADAQNLIKELEKTLSENKIGNVEVEEWFPEAVKKTAQKIDDQTLIEGDAYAPDLFLQAPYSGGKLIRVGETNYFVLKVFTF